MNILSSSPATISFPLAPLCIINFTRHDRVVALVTQMLELNKKLQDATLDHEKTLLSRQVEAADGAIDKLVNELYGLTEVVSILSPH